MKDTKSSQKIKIKNWLSIEKKHINTIVKHFFSFRSLGVFSQDWAEQVGYKEIISVESRVNSQYFALDFRKFARKNKSAANQYA